MQENPLDSSRPLRRFTVQFLDGGDLRNPTNHIIDWWRRWHRNAARSTGSWPIRQRRPSGTDGRAEPCGRRVPRSLMIQQAVAVSARTRCSANLYSGGRV